MNRLGRIARRVVRRIVGQKMLDAIRGGSPESGSGAVERAASEQRDAVLTALERRVHVLERDFSREVDRARELEGSRLLQERANNTSAALAELRKTIERRGAAIADRILVLQREVDAQRLLQGEFGRDLLSDRSRLATVQANVGDLHVLLAKTTDDVRSVFDSMVARLDGLTAAVGALDIGRSEMAGRADVLQDVTEGLAAQMNGLRGTLMDVVGRQRAVPYMARPIFPAPPLPNGARESFDYVAFEEIFRGPEELVRDRQRVYVQFLKAGQRVVDLGCGRGEFLELAREAGISAVGIEINPEMVRRCTARGLDVREADARSFLDGELAASVDTIFSAQFIEHLSPGDLYALFVAARRVLAPGGLLIAETVNPHSIEALKCFYVDLSHVKPLFPEVMLYYARSAGFSDGRIFFPTGGGFEEQAPWERGEYALIATA